MNNNKLYEKFKTINAISNFEKEDMELKVQKRSILKMVATFLLATGITGGLVYATGTAIEKIWKEPESYTIKSELSQEEKEKCISEAEAEKIGNDYLNKIGLSNENIQALDLRKEYFSGENIWEMGSQKATLRIDGETREIKSVQIPTWNYTIPYNYGISRVEARKVARELLEKYNPKNDNDQYELVSLKRNNENDEDAYIWYADFYKKYGDLINPSESIKIGWIPTINGLYSLSIDNNSFENNEQKISKEESIKIAIEKDNQIETTKTIKETNAELKIKQMNENVYLRENFKEDYEKGILNLEKVGENFYKIKDDAIFYKTEERVRKVWVVVVKYDVADDSSTMPSYSYYIDCTTGEIIGGQKWDILLSDEQISDDPNNVIEK